MLTIFHHKYLLQYADDTILLQMFKMLPLWWIHTLRLLVNGPWVIECNWTFQRFLWCGLELRVTVLFPPSQKYLCVTSILVLLCKQRYLGAYFWWYIPFNGRIMSLRCTNQCLIICICWTNKDWFLDRFAEIAHREIGVISLSVLFASLGSSPYNVINWNIELFDSAYIFESMNMFHTITLLYSATTGKWDSVSLTLCNASSIFSASTHFVCSTY